ncbi:MAG: binary toxin-like calcium binding domain-containing protein [Candidatus Kariarchaeaceae archaeon]
MTPYFLTFDTQFNKSSNYDPDPTTGIKDFDSDDGGVKDGDELKSTILNGTYVWDPRNPADDAFADSDGDGLPNQWEEAWAALGAILDPDSNNTDGDAILDGDEDFDTDGLTNRQEYEIGTSPIDDDTDGDGLLDGDEVNNWQSDPLKEDSDQDGITDFEEVSFFTSIDGSFTYNTNYDGDSKVGINDPDSDNDGLLDGQEKSMREGQYPLIDPRFLDSDGDILTDGEEVLLYHTNPTSLFTDPDLLTDFQEVITYLTNPLDPDTDHDGLDDYQEVIVWGSSALIPDSDGDGLEDGFEVLYFQSWYGLSFNETVDFDSDGLNSLLDDDSDNDHYIVGVGLTDAEELAFNTDPGAKDTDQDQLNDYIEVNGFGFMFDDGTQLLYFTNPLDNDTDADSLLDGEEVLGITVNYRGQIYTYHTDPTSRDTDMDGLTDGIEVAGIDIKVMGQNLTVKTNPEHPDTDGDRISDLEEIISWNWQLSSNFAEPPQQMISTINLAGFEEAGPPIKVDVQVQPYYTKIAALRIGYITDPTDNDTDADGLLDGEEKYDSMVMPTTYTPTRTIDTASIPLLTAPTNNDTDWDGLSDGEEVKTYLSNPQLQDTDRDGLSDYEEITTFSTNPHSHDSDFDQLSDKYELQMSYHNSTLPSNKTDPLDPDTDADGLVDGFEVHFLATHPLDPDSDDDNLLDGKEAWQTMKRSMSTSPIHSMLILMMMEFLMVLRLMVSNLIPLLEMKMEMDILMVGIAIMIMIAFLTMKRPCTSVRIQQRRIPMRMV